VPKIVAERRGEYDSSCETTVLRAALCSYEVFNEARCMTDHLRPTDGKPTVLAALELTFCTFGQSDGAFPDPSTARSWAV
jgi:hypothetical protein